MRLLVLGATGKTGQVLVAQGLARGHSVTAFGRSAFRDARTRAFRIVIGNPLQVDDLAAALPGHDAVLSVLGTRGLGATSLLADSARACLDAMHRTGVRRLIAVSSSLVDPRSGWLSRALARTLVRHIAGDQRAMEAMISQSQLDWTVLRPARLDDGALTGHNTATVSTRIPASNAAMSRKDLAAAMLDTVECAAYVRQIVWLRGGRA